MVKTIREAMNRGNNLMMTVIMAGMGVGVFAEVFREAEIIDKIDDGIFVLLALGAVLWYFRGRNRYNYSWTPFIFLALALVDKAAAMINEFNDPTAIGDEFGVVPVIVVFIIVSLVILIRTRRMNESLEAGQMMTESSPVMGEDK